MSWLYNKAVEGYKCGIPLASRKALHMTTRYKFLTSLVFSAGTLAAIAAMPAAGAWADELVTNGPQFDAGDRSGSWSAQRNVQDSQRYEAMVQTNPSFRANRVRKECGPIADQQMHAECLASFGGKTGSSLPGGRDYR
jgi:hypothetical protein